ncbi:hypothetical protein Zmor_015361 [Zophobas morio]|uniref:Sialin n=1 Tax=Zophobas morio TaxID=2755281 RepID=A0AA38MHF5_9CUCU|nr:hypothetical protein Zmor_015361 [Zophobas morio]
MSVLNEKQPPELSDKIVTENYPMWKFWKRRRYIVAIFAFFGFFNVYALRANLSIAIVAMVENKTTTLENGTIVYGPEFDWDSTTQGLVLSSFFYGYITTQFFGGWISAKIGGKRVYGIGIAVTAFLTLLTPWLTTVSVYLLLAIRIIEGIFEGVTYPCMHSIWARWAPPLERARLVTISFSGSYIGTVISMPASAYLATELGWPSVFYVFGAIALVWYVFWCFFVSESPIDDPRISQDELEYIKHSLGNVEAKRDIKHPWKEILTSIPVWAIIVSHFVDNWGFYTLLTQLPTFMKDMFDYDLGKTGFLSGLPYLAMAIMMQFSGHLADWLREKKVFTTTQVRKIFTCTSFILHAIFMVAAVYLTTAAGTVVCLVLAVGLGVCTWSGFGVNYLDIAPQHASVLMGISNTFATLAGILTPLVTGFIVTTSSPHEWQIVFCIAGGIFVLGSIVYGIFASGDIQPWAVETEATTEKEDIGYENKSYEDVESTN